ncbi:hypothetical protein N803_12705 [Knoellia subterranea KCTC 19937]|uniref:HTH cro/C1-type domain-containing protein n=1 Tax=Knoellia subterranea KCTC 19937 TaxID=1385521 RepID=A0A0A0JKE2_9MICO|nr:hypothetical protein N803_12705 [Knoellia subterranea KCTC 19937]
MAERVGIDKAVLARYETGAQQPTLPALERLVAGCGYELRWSLNNIGAVRAGASAVSGVANVDQADAGLVATIDQADAGVVATIDQAGACVVTEGAPALALPGPIGRRISANLAEVLDVLAAIGATDPCLYGDIANGCEGVASRVFIGVTPAPDTSFNTLLSTSGRLGMLLRVDVRVMRHDEVPDRGPDGAGVPLTPEGDPPMSRSA